MSNYRWSGKIEIDVVNEDGTCSHRQSVELVAEKGANLKAALMEYLNQTIKDAS